MNRRSLRRFAAVVVVASFVTVLCVLVTLITGWYAPAVLVGGFATVAALVWSIDELNKWV